MDEVIETYKQGKFQKCLEMIKLLPPADNIVDNFILENCLLVIESTVKILKRKVENASETEEKLYLFFGSVTSFNIVDTNVFLNLKLTATYNYFWWILFFNTPAINLEENELYLDKIYEGLCRVAGDTKYSNSSYSAISDKIVNQLSKLKDLNKTKNCLTTLLLVDLVVVVLLIISKFSEEMFHKCINKIKFFLWDLKATIYSAEFKIDFKKCNTSLEIFKFGLNKRTTLLSSLDISCLDFLQFLEAVSFFILENFEESVKSLQKSQNFSPLWSYLKALNLYKLNRTDECFKYLKKISNMDMESHLKMRIFILKGQLYSEDKNYKKSLKHFEKALNLKLNSPLPYFYIGQQYGKMGLHELMAEWFEKLLWIIRDEKKEVDYNCNVEEVLLDCIHGSDEIMETEALYSVAISYSLNEKFKEASNIFERILQSYNSNNGMTNRVIHMPSWLTVLHEASVINLLAGNLTRAEDIASDAISQYLPQKVPLIFREKNSFVCKDIYWLQRAIEEELLGNKITLKKLAPKFIYTEDLFFFFPQNIIALLIKAEIQKIQGMENYKFILKKIFSFLSDYIALIVKKQEVDETEKYICLIVKALTSKVCLWLANSQVSNNNSTYIEKMFKRALGCNKGDKDVFFNYCNFLLKNGKTRDASKLWNTYCDEKPSIPLDCIHSLSLCYFLETKITKRDMEEIQNKIK